MMFYTPALTRLLAAPPPVTIPNTTWSRYLADAERLVAKHGPALHAAGWTDLDLFGIPAVAPMVRVDGAGLAWLLGGKPVGRITPETVEIVQAGGHTLRMARLSPEARRVSVLGWEAG